MSFGEIKKAVNSDLGKPLDVLITEKADEVKTATASQASVDIVTTAIGATNATGGTATAGGIFAKLNKLLTDWTTARAGKIDNLDAAISTRASQTGVDSLQTTVNAKSSQTSVTAVQTTANSILSRVNSMPTGAVKSVQRGFFDGYSTKTPAGVLINHNAVDLNKSLLFVSGFKANYAGSGLITASRSSTNFLMEGSSSSTYAFSFSWELIEFY